MTALRTAHWIGIGIGTGALALIPQIAEACGCFAPATPAEPVVQAGERIVFSQDDGKVTAYVQVQYEGPAKEFAWLVPVPEVPEVRVGSEELFTALEATTGPQFILNQRNICASGSAIGCGDDSFALSNNASPPEPEPTPVAVVQSSAGPYDFAVVRADNKDPMLQWLRDNGFFVPTTTEDVLDPYIRPGAYFLALRLRSGKSAGDIQPVVLEYEADRPMIPIILTSVAANPDMGILVWVLGQHRAIPRNYRHVEINEEYIDWFNQASNYSEVVARAVDEADGGHAFITEYAGSTRIMQDVLDPPGRFGDRADFEGVETLEDYESLLRSSGFTWDTLVPIFKGAFPMPSAATDAGINEDEYYANLAASVSTWHPAAEFNPADLTEEIWTRVVEPTREAGALFHRHQKMTRLYTALSPEEMTEDPVFDFNPDLEDVSNQHFATSLSDCDGASELVLSDGRNYRVKQTDRWRTRDRFDAPRTTMIQILNAEGPGTIEIDNREELSRLSQEGVGGCQSSGRSQSGLITFLLMLGLVTMGRSVMQRR